MTLNDAYKVLGVDRHSAFADIQKAYQCRLTQLQLKLSACTSPPDRQMAQDMIKELVEAWATVQKNAPPVPQTKIPRPQPKTSRHSTNTPPLP